MSQETIDRVTKLIDDFKIIGRRNVICGLHIHVGIPAGMSAEQALSDNKRYAAVWEVLQALRGLEQLGLGRCFPDH